MINYAQMKRAVVNRREVEPDISDRFPVIVRLADGSVVTVKAAEVTPNPQTGEMSVMLDTRETI